MWLANLSKPLSQSSLGVWLCLALPVAAAFGGCSSDDDDSASSPVCRETATEMYDRRIKPLLSEDQPKTCNQCHLSGIDLGMFARDNACEAMACLVEDGLVNLKAPEQSTILGWIQRAKPASGLITQDVVDQEYQGFLEWINYNATCGKQHCADAKCGPKTDAPFCALAKGNQPVIDPATDPGDCSDKTLEELFLTTVYAARGRCYPCHFDSVTTATSEAARWIAQSGTCEAASLTTMRNVIRSEYINYETPENSLLLLKPLSVEGGGIEHGGHAKFQKTGDSGYDNFLYWLKRYATCNP
jgi:hypothetical protein